MRVTGVIQSKHWRDKITGQTCSIYGVCPFNDPELVVTGWTTMMSNNTVGRGRQPFETREVAEQFASDWNRRFDEYPVL